MASGGRQQESNVPDMYNCAVCLEYLLNKKPRYLSCHHYFCETCLQNLVRNSNITCPTCRRDTPVPNDDVTSLQSNYLLEQMMQREQQFGPKESSKCLYCSVNKAECKCKDCGHLLCVGCRSKHDKMKAFAGHAIQSLCDKHDDGVSHICMECLHEICKVCMVFEHSDHEDKVKVYSEGIQNMKTEMTKIKEEINRKNSTLTAVMQNELVQKTLLDGEVIKLENQNKALQSQIDANNYKLKTLADKARQVTDKIGLANIELQKYKSFVKFVIDAEKSNNQEMIKQFKDIKERKNELIAEDSVADSFEIVGAEKVKFDKEVEHLSAKKTCHQRSDAWRLYCTTCKVAVCDLCRSRCHRGHFVSGSRVSDKCYCGTKGSSCQSA